MHRGEHFTVTTLEQVQQAKKLDLGISHTIGHVKYWGQAFRDYILHSYLEPSQADSLSYVRIAATRLTYNQDGQVQGQDQIISVEAALAGVTINPARQVMLDSEIWSLEKGNDTNFVVLAQHIIVAHLPSMPKILTAHG